MARRTIAAALLVAMAAWAEMAMAPMLVMHAGHMRPGHEMAGDMLAAEPAAHHHAEHAQLSGHPCCPRHSVEPEAVLALTASAPACNDPHSCCFRQGPQSVPAPASEVQKLARGMTPARIATLSPAVSALKRTIGNRVFAFCPPPDGFGMTLRV